METLRNNGVDNNKDTYRALQKTIPHNLEAEKALVASMLMDMDAIEQAMSMVTKDDFYSRQYGLLFEVITKAYNASGGDSVIDIVTVVELLGKAGAPASMLTADYIRELYEASPVSVNARAYAGIVRDSLLFLVNIRPAC